jgi:hypothetical protein
VLQPSVNLRMDQAKGKGEQKRVDHSGSVPESIYKDLFHLR